MERLDPDQFGRLRVASSRPFAYLVAGPVRECETQYAFRLDSRGDRIGHSLCKDKGLACTHRRHNQQTSVSMLGYPALSVIESDLFCGHLSPPATHVGYTAYSPPFSYNDESISSINRDCGRGAMRIREVLALVIATYSKRLSTANHSSRSSSALSAGSCSGRTPSDSPVTITSLPSLEVTLESISSTNDRSPSLASPRPMA